MPAVHGEGVGADALDARAERHEELAEVLHVRLAGGALRRMVVPLAATAAISAFSVAVTLGSSRKTSAPTSPLVVNVIRSEHVRGAELLERQEMRVEAPPADDVAARRRSVTSPQRASSGAASRMDARIRRHSPGGRCAGPRGRRPTAWRRRSAGRRSCCRPVAPCRSLCPPSTAKKGAMGTKVRAAPGGVKRSRTIGRADTRTIGQADARHADGSGSTAPGSRLLDTPILPAATLHHAPSGSAPPPRSR